MEWLTVKFAGKKILVVAPDFPYPPNHGGRVDVWGRIKALRNLGFTIDLAATSKIEPTAAENAEVKKYVRTIYYCPRKNRLRHFISLRPLQIESRAPLADIAFDNLYDIALLESEYVLSVTENRSLSAGVFVIRLMDNSAVYFSELASSVNFGLRKIYFQCESWKFKGIERKVFDNIRNLMFISAAEFGDFTARYRDINAVFLPPAVDVDKMKEITSDTRNVLFIGSLFMANNLNGAIWYLQEVHPLISNYHLVIAGNTRGKGLSILKKETGTFNNVEIIESPAELSSLYESSAVFINPMRHGAGVKVKNIEAIRNGLPVVSTSAGNEGTGLIDGEEICVADDPKKFASYITELLQNRALRIQILKKAQQRLKRDYDQEKILDAYFTKILERSP